eukprot:4897345-Amphidinium_carterae.1
MAFICGLPQRMWRGTDATHILSRKVLRVVGCFRTRVKTLSRPLHVPSNRMRGKMVRSEYKTGCNDVLLLELYRLVDKQ